MCFHAYFYTVIDEIEMNLASESFRFGCVIIQAFEKVNTFK